MIQCNACQKYLPETAFYDYVKWRRCKECVKEHARKRYHTCEDTKRGVRSVTVVNSLRGTG